MSDNSELHARILGFVMAEWARKDNRQLVSVDLMYAPGQGFRDEEVRKWVRADEPDFFAEFQNIEKLVTLIIEIAEGEADAKPAGKHRFYVRTNQHLGGTARLSFALQPSYAGQDDSALAIANGGGGGGGGRGGGGDVAVAQILAGNNAQLMRTNTQMFDGTIRVFGHQVQNLHEQVMALTSENIKLRGELEEARSNKMDREFQIAMAAEKNARTNAGFQKALQLGSVIVAKFAAGNEGAAQLGEAAPLPMLLAEFYQSLRPDQMTVFMQTLEMGQKIMFMEIVNLVKPKDRPPGQPPSPGGPGGNGARP
jgi:hypothetical protein